MHDSAKQASADTSPKATEEALNDDYLWSRREALLYRTELSARYHRKRERFLSFWDRATVATALILGSAAFANLGGGQWVKVYAATIAVSSTWALVFGLADGARRHNALTQRFLDLESQIIRRGERDFTEADLNLWEAEVREIEAAEPPAYESLVTACQNEIAEQRGQPESIHPIGFWRRLTMQILPGGHHHSPPRAASRA